MHIQKEQPPALLTQFRLQNRFGNLLIATIALSVILRISAAFYLGNQVMALPGTADQESYHNLALRLLAGHGFTFGGTWWPLTAAGEPTAHWSYLYTFYLAIVYAVFGPHPLVARLIQAVIVGILQPYLAYRVGRLAFGETIGLVAAVLTAVYAYFIYYAGTLMTEPFYITAIMAGFYVAILLANELSKADTAAPGYKLALVLGLILGITVLLRQLFLLIIPFMYLWIWWAGRQNRVSYLSGFSSRLTALYRPLSLSLSAFNREGIILSRLFLTTAIIAALILPFTIYNYSRFGRFVLLNTNAGFAFYWANHPIYGNHFEPILPREMGSYQSLIPAELRHLDEAALDQALLRRGLQFVVDDPVRYVRLSLSRIPAYFMFWPSNQSGLVSNVARVASFGLLWPFMLLGVGLWLRYRWKRSLLVSASSPATLLLLFALVYTVIHLLSWALIRYRLPVDAALLTFAALALVRLIKMRSSNF